jgi:8-oxo-dGTP pyrophosphatase MutT (NUDIX family)
MMERLLLATLALLGDEPAERVSVWSGLPERIAAIVTILVPIVTLAIAGLRSSRRFRRFILTAAFRRPLRTAELPVLLPRGEWRRRWHRYRQRRQLVVALAGTFVGTGDDGPLIRALDGEDVLPVDILSELLASGPYSRSAEDDRGGFARDLERVTRAAATTRAQGLLARLLYPDDVRALRQLAASLADHLSRFACALTVTTTHPLGLAGSCDGSPGAPPGSPASFAEFVTALSGAVVLADSVDTRSRYVDDVLLWHRRAHRATSRPTAPGADGRDGYADEHDAAGNCSIRLPSELDRRVGDFDRRVLTFRSLEIVSSPEKGRVSFVLDTSETCYLASEQGEALGEVTDPVGCKHLLPRPGADPGFSLRLPGWNPEAEGHERRYVVERPTADEGPVMLITSYVSLLTRDGSLVLARRTSHVRHGQGVISATAGGVIEPDGEGRVGDVDERGMPSPLVGVLRETQEELGLTLSPRAPKPVAIFLANARNLGRVGDVDSPRAGRGQLVLTVLYLCRVTHDLPGLREVLLSADPSLGGFEVDDLVEFGTTKMAGWSLSRRLAREARDRASWLDQHGLLSCLYAAAVADGPKVAQEEFRRAFAERPWWAIGGGSDGEMLPRVVRDPRVLLHGSLPSSTALPLEELVTSGCWEQEWEDLPRRLRDERRRMLEAEGAAPEAEHLDVLAKG